MSTIAAIATPHGMSGVAMIRVSGNDAIPIATKVFQPISKRSLTEYSGYQASYGTIVDFLGNKIDDGVALVFRAPHSYTGEDVVEITCHGSIAGSELVLKTLLEQGAVLAGRGEFTKRAFLNGKMDLTAAEGVAKLIEAESELAVTLANQVKMGELQEKITDISQSLTTLVAKIQVLLDYPEEDIEQEQREEIQSQLSEESKKLQQLMQRYQNTRMVREGATVVFVGEPNVGKSTLMNLLIGEEKSIVTDIAGTTRDLVESRMDLNGLLVRMIDTAGLRETEEPIEKIGVERTRETLSKADVAVFVVDSSRPVKEQLAYLRQQPCNCPVILVMNKIDLTTVQLEQEEFERVVYTSQTMPDTMEELRFAIAQTLKISEYDPHLPALLNERQFVAVKAAQTEVDDALQSLSFGMTLDVVSLSLEEGIDFLLELTGEKASEAVIDEIFSKFCVGK